MADWGDIINNRLTMGRSRPLIYALNAAQRRREKCKDERRLGLIPPAGRGIRLVFVVPRFKHFGEFQEENYCLDNTARGRSRPFPAPHPFLQIHHQFQLHSLPHCMAHGFGGYMNPNIPCSPRVNNPPLQVPNPQHYVPPPPPPQDQDSLMLCLAHPKLTFCLL